MRIELTEREAGFLKRRVEEALDEELGWGLVGDKEWRQFLETLKAKLNNRNRQPSTR